MGEERSSLTTQLPACPCGSDLKRKSREISVGVSLNGGFPQKPWVFLLKMISTWGVKWGYHHLRKHPYGVFIWLCKIGTTKLTKGWI